jgi:hypothetical protein
VVCDDGLAWRRLLTELPQSFSSAMWCVARCGRAARRVGVWPATRYAVGRRRDAPVTLPSSLHQLGFLMATCWSLVGTDGGSSRLAFFRSMVVMGSQVRSGSMWPLQGLSF